MSQKSSENSVDASNENTVLDRRFCVAPMMDWTDRHQRFFLRCMSKHALLYTEMVTTGAVIHGDRNHLLGFSKQEHPVAAQLGGSDPKELAESAKIVEDYGYDEVNLNVGCPSDRVQSGRFGACLMLEPERVASCVSAMREAVKIPVTVKCRLGVDDKVSEDFLYRFIDLNIAAGCEVFIIHARAAWLQGLSPKENREIPPLNYDAVYAAKKAYPNLTIVINGGVKTLEETKKHLEFVDGVMIGREAYHNPYLLSQVDSELFSTDDSIIARRDVLEKMRPYINAYVESGKPMSHITRHMLGLFNGVPGARKWRRYLSENVHKTGASYALIDEALALMKA